MKVCIFPHDRWEKTMKKEFLNWLKSLAPKQTPLSVMAKSARRLRRKVSPSRGSVKHRMAVAARKKLH